MNITIEVHEFGSFVFRPALGRPDVPEPTAPEPTEIPLRLSVPKDTTPDGERIVFGPPVLSFG